MEAPAEDNSVLKPPIPTAIEGVKGYVHAYENGTAEVRHILLNECDVILECKVCKNLFRSLANFTSHKRFYCKVDYSEVRLQVDANSRVESGTEVVQAEEVLEMTSQALAGENDPPDKGEPKEIKRKALTSIVDKLLSRAGGVPITGQSVFKPPVNATESFAKIQEVVEKRNALNVVNKIRLEPVKGSKHVVYQSNTSASMKSDVEELAQRDTIVPVVKPAAEAGSDVTNANPSVVNKVAEPAKPVVNGEAVNEVTKFSLKKFMNVNGGKHRCTDCSTYFTTELNLKDHIIVQHLDGRVRYLCPVCEKPFPAATNLRKHLRDTHQKSGKSLEEALRKVVRKVHVSTEKAALLSPQKTDVNVTEVVKNDQKNPREVTPGSDKACFRPLPRERHQSTGSMGSGSSLPELTQNKVSSIQVRKDYTKKPATTPPAEKLDTSLASPKALAIVHSYTKANCCTICGSKYTSPDSITRHIAQVHIDWFRYICTLCGYKNFSKFPVSRHAGTMHAKVTDKPEGLVRPLSHEEQEKVLLTTPEQVKEASAKDTPRRTYPAAVSDNNDNIKLADAKRDSDNVTLATLKRENDSDNLKLADIKRGSNKTQNINIIKIEPPIVSVSESVKSPLPTNGVTPAPPRRKEVEIKPRPSLTPPTSQRINRKNLSTDRKLFIVLPMPKKKEKPGDSDDTSASVASNVESSPDSKASTSSVDDKENKAKKGEPIIASVSESVVSRKRKNSTPPSSVAAKRK